MTTRPKLLIAGIVSLTLLGIAGARIQARLSAHSSLKGTQVAEETEALSVQYASLGEEVFARRFEMREGRLEVDLSDADGDILLTAPADIAADVYMEGEDRTRIDLASPGQLKNAPRTVSSAGRHCLG